jgi:hypothetical protein
MVEIIIRLTDAGQIEIAGQIDNALFAYGMLEIARQVIAKHHADAASRLVQPATATPMNLQPINGGRRG